jgi:hypothetical protein
MSFESRDNLVILTMSVPGGKMMSDLDHLPIAPLNFNTLTLEHVRSEIELKQEAKGQDKQLRRESEGGCPTGFRSPK